MNVLDVKKQLKKYLSTSMSTKFHKNNFLLSQKNNLISLSIALLIFFFDRLTKIKAINHQIENNKVYINDYINIDLVWNTGIGFGLLSSNSNIIYNSISMIIGIVIIFLIYLIFKSNIIDKILFSMIIGGALGNFYDRVTFFAVPDFIDMHYQNFHWFTFNIADIFISIGLITLIIKDFFNKNEKN
tara:strand:+ start:1250 stop:1807 length:558 start_codon:yes stop_codon:yes gene_type:complete